MSLPDPRPTLDAPDDDPYLWLEDIEGPRALDWVEAQNAATLQRFGHGPFAADRDALKAIFDRPDNIPYPAPARREAVQLVAGCLASPRPVANMHAGELPQRELPPGTSCSISTRLPPRKAKTGHSKALRSCPARMTAPFSTCRAAAPMPSCCASSTSRPATSCRTAFISPNPRASTVWLDRDTLLLLSPLGSGHGDALGLCAHCAAVAEGNRPARGPGHIRDARRALVRLRRRRSGQPGRARVVRGEARPHRHQRMDRRPHRAEDAARYSDRRLAVLASGVARGEAAHRLDRRWGDLWDRHRRRHFLRGLSGRRPSLHQAVRAGRPARLAIILLVRRSTGLVDPR